MKDFSDRPGDDAAAGDEGDAVDDAGGQKMWRRQRCCVASPWAQLRHRTRLNRWSFPHRQAKKYTVAVV